MTRGFRNVYDDDERAGAYADLGFPGTCRTAISRDFPENKEARSGDTVSLLNEVMLPRVGRGHLHPTSISKFR